MKTEKLGGVAGGEGECGDHVAGWLVRERRSLHILPVKKEAKLSASEVPGEVVGSSEEDLRCRSLLTVELNAYRINRNYGFQPGFYRTRKTG